MSNSCNPPIDWKHLATTRGYRKLKQAMIEDIHAGHRSKQELHDKFNWVICRAKHYAHRLNKPIEDVLNEWEDAREVWWIRYYSNHHQSKIVDVPTQPRSLRGAIRRYKNRKFRKKSTRSVRDLSFIWELQKQNSMKVKPRWSNEKKARARYWREHEKRSL